MSTMSGDGGRRPGAPWWAGDVLTKALVDDAAIFPPGNAALTDAVRAHHAHRTSWYGPAVGPLLVRLSDARALNDLLDHAAGLSTALVCPPTASARDLDRAITEAQRHEAAAVRALEQPVDSPADLSGVVTVAGDHGALVWAEVPQACTLDGTLDQRLDDVSAAGAGAKYRTGGVTPQAFPTEQQLARFVLGCVSRRQPFKLTAGLHHTVRQTAGSPAPGGPALEQHGLLNVISAVAAAQDGAGEEDLVSVLAERDARRVADAVKALDHPALARVRQSFISFGCCGVTDPLTDLVTLGVLYRPADKETS